MMRCKNNKTGVCRALTLLEMVIALAMMAVVFAVIVPQFRNIRTSWDSKQGIAETLQNGRILTDHLSRNLAKAVRVTAVSAPDETAGFIEFEDNDASTLRYDVNSTSNYVEFGSVGELYELAGPVSQLQFTCYDACDLDTPLDISTADVNDIRFVKVQTTLTNPAALGQDKTFIAWTYLRTSWNPCSSGLVGWWKLDETSGLTAADSSGNDNDGTLENMAGNEWTEGVLGGALEFDGNNDYVNCGDTSSLQITGDLTIAAWVQLETGNSGAYYGIAGKMNTNYSGFTLTRHSSNYFYFWIGNGTLEEVISNTTYTDTYWHHVAGVRRDGTNYLYIDGVEQTATNTRALSDSGSWAFIGRQYDDYNDRYFDGVIDDVRIYNRALSAEEITRLAEIVTYQNFTEAKADSDTTSITISTPSDTNEGDLLIAAVATDGDTDFSLSPPGGEGWTEIDIDDYSSEVTLGAWWKNADASESSSHEFTWSGSEQAYGWMTRFTGHDPDDPVDVWATDGETSSTPTSPAVTTTAGNRLILRLGGFDDEDITVDAPGLSGHTAITMDGSGSSAGTVTYEEFTEAKASSDTTSITISTPGLGGGGVTILGSWTSGLTHTVEAGSNRALIFTAHHQDNETAGSYLDTVTYGGQSMTQIEESEYYASPYHYYVAAWVLDEAGIAAASGDNFVVSWSDGGPSNTPGYSSVFLQNVDQANPIGASDTSNCDCEILSTSALANNSGDMVMLTAFHGGNSASSTDYECLNGFTEAIEFYNPPNSGEGMCGYKAATGVSETPSVDSQNTDYSGRQALVGFVVQVNEFSAPSIEGDLLIAAVATDSSETISAPGGEGWTLIDHGSYSSYVTLGVWWKLAGASESSSHQFTWGSSEQAYGWMMRFTGHHSTTPINASAAQGGYSSSPDCPSVTTTVTNTMILRMGGFDDDDVTVDNPGLSGHTAITMDESNPSSSYSCSGGAGYVLQQTVGDSGISEFSLTGTEEYRTVTIAIAPATVDSGGVSGGAGYVRQSSSGDSGTSTFSLTASEESRTLTIAISPNPGSGGDCEMLP